MICLLGFFPQVSPSLAATPGIPSGQGVLPCGSLPPKTPAWCLLPASPCSPHPLHSCSSLSAPAHLVCTLLGCSAEPAGRESLRIRMGMLR